MGGGNGRLSAGAGWAGETGRPDSLFGGHKSGWNLRPVDGFSGGVKFPNWRDAVGEGNHRERSAGNFLCGGHRWRWKGGRAQNAFHRVRGGQPTTPVKRI